VLWKALYVAFHCFRRGSHKVKGVNDASSVLFETLVDEFFSKATTRTSCSSCSFIEEEAGDFKTHGCVGCSFRVVCFPRKRRAT
jgi:hypothetical protein